MKEEICVICGLILVRLLIRVFFISRELSEKMKNID